MSVWRFFDYVGPSGHSVIEDWLVGNPSRRANLDAMLAYLAILPDWSKQPRAFKWLKGVKSKGLGEIRFECDRLPHRVFGCLGDSPGRFILLVGCCKQTTKYSGGALYFPPNAFELAAQRRDEYDDHRATVVERLLI